MTVVSTTAVPPLVMLQDHASSLTRHVAQCRAARGRWFTAASVAERLHLVFAPRFVTTVALAAALLLAAGAWI